MSSEKNRMNAVFFGVLGRRDELREGGPVEERVSRLPRVAAVQLLLKAGKWGKLPFRCRGPESWLDEQAKAMINLIGKSLY